MIKERILQFLNNEGLSPSQFAEVLGIQRSSISHILSGRNKPSYDFFDKLLEKYPNINLEWFFKGKNAPYKEEKSLTDTHTIIKQNKPKGNSDNFSKTSSVINVTNVNSVKKIIVLFTDGTFESYSPKENETI